MKRHSLLFFGVFFSLFCVAANVSPQDGKTIDGGVLNGKAIKLVIPDYPPAAKSVNAGGAVSVQITIDEEGNVAAASAVSGHPLLRQSSEKAAKESKFSPTTLSGKPVKVTGILVYNFTPGRPAQNTNNAANDEIEEDALNGQAVKLPAPVYPAAAKAVKASGKVRVQVTLDEKGNVTSAKTISGHPLLRLASENAAKEAKFDPKDIKDKKIKTEGVLVYVFADSPKNKE